MTCATFHESSEYNNLRSNEMILRRDVVPHVFRPLLFSLNTLALRWQDSFAEAFREHRSRRDFVHPFYAFGEDFGVDGVLQVACVDGRCLERIGAGDVDASTGQRMFEADQKTGATLAFGRRAEEFDLALSL